MNVHIFLAIEIDGHKSYAEFNDYEMTTESLKHRARRNMNSCNFFLPAPNSTNSTAKDVLIHIPIASLIQLMEGKK